MKKVVPTTEERRSEFIDAAERLFKKKGIVNTTVNSIVKEVDVAKGLFYYYFKSKDDVIEAIADKYNRVFVKGIQKALSNSDYDERLEDYIRNVIISFRQLWGNLHGENENIDLSILATKTFDEAKQMASQVLQDLLKEGVETNRLNIKNISYYSDMIISGIVDLISREDSDLKEIEQFIQELINQVRKENENGRFR